METPRTLIIAPWGKPSNWILAEYVFDDGSQSFTSFTSLHLVARRYKEARIVILVADTLAEKPFNNYKDLVGSVKRYVKQFLCGLDAEIEVLPGNISSSNYLFKGRMSDYYYRTLHVILKYLHETMAGRIVVDLTHGVNYMPALTLKAAEEAAAVIAFTRSLMGNKGSVELIVYNSDPILPNKEERKLLERSNDSGDPCKPRSQDPNIKPPRLRINRVFKRRYTSLDLLSNLEPIIGIKGDRHVPLHQSARECMISSDIKKELESAYDKATCILRMLRYGLIPQLAWFIVKNPDVEDMLQNTIDKVEKLWEEGIQLSTGNESSSKELEVWRCRRFEDSYRALLYSYYILRAFNKLLQKENPENGISLRTISKIQDSLKNSRIIWIIQNREREKLKKNVEGKTLENWTPLSAIYSMGRMEGKDEKYGIEMFKRDLIAHGGWHTDVIELKTNESGLYYRIRSDFRCKSGGGSKTIWEILCDPGF